MLSDSEKKYSLSLPKKALGAHLQNENFSLTREEVIQELSSHTSLLENMGCFVTWKKQKELRGCIGSIVSEEPLYINILKNSILSATNDPRFPAITLDEIEDLSVEISVMGALTPVKKIQEIRVGTHGLIVRRGVKQGLLLPQVPVEWAWDRDTFLMQTCVKAGIDPEHFDDPATKYFCFTAEVISDKSPLSSK